MLEALKIQLGDEAVAADEQAQQRLDAKLQLILDDAAQFILSYCSRQEVPKTLEPTQRMIALILYNREGTEGEQSHSEGSISRSYGADYPESVYKALRPYCMGRVMTL